MKAYAWYHCAVEVLLFTLRRPVRADLARPAELPSAGEWLNWKGPQREFRALASAGQRHDTERAEKDLHDEDIGGVLQRTAMQ